MGTVPQFCNFEHEPHIWDRLPQHQAACRNLDHFYGEPKKDRDLFYKSQVGSSSSRLWFAELPSEQEKQLGPTYLSISRMTEILSWQKQSKLYYLFLSVLRSPLWSYFADSLPKSLRTNPSSFVFWDRTALNSYTMQHRWYQLWYHGRQDCS